mmetsp:Transcript_68687/g.123782  ORF Transcript_68687/g.123782 Transcript_68687/m.123782 type:complete len:280 (+) Transcript_68687:94-933(+)
MAASTKSQKADPRSRAPDVNLFDMPEMLPGARSNANPAQKDQLDQRCRQVHEDNVQEECEAAEEEVRSASGSQVTFAELEAWFPTLDAELVQALCRDAPTPQHAIETLLALSAATADAAGAGSEGVAPRATTPPPRNFGAEDNEQFPSLVDKNGWQVGNQRLFERDPEEELGSAWRDCAKAAKDMPSPKATQPSIAWGGRRRKGKKADDSNLELQEPMTDYEYRHSAGERREQNRAQYGRSTRQGVASTGGGEEDRYVEGGPEEADGSESEASEVPAAP